MAKSTSILSLLAKELGYKDVKQLKERLQHGDTFAGSVKSRLEEGQGFGESFRGGFQDKKESIKRSLDPKALRKKAYMSLFSGDNILSANMRGRFNKKEAEEKDKEEESLSPSGISNNDALSSIVNSSMALPGIAKDMNILRQNISSLAKLERKTEEQQDLSKQGDFFKEQGQEEANLEAGRKKPKEAGKATVIKNGEGGEDGGGEGFLGGIIGSLKNGLLGSLGSLFNPMALLKLLGKAFAIGALLYSLFEGITAGFKKWQETGDLGEAIIAGLGAMLDFITFGLFGEEQLKEFIGKIGDVIGPIIDSIKETYYSMKDWIANNIGINKHTFFEGTPAEFSIGPYYPFKKDSSSEAKQDTAGEFKAQRMEEKVQKETQKATDFIGGVTKDLKGGVDSVAKEINSSGEKLTSLVKDLPKDKKGQVDIFGKMIALTENNLNNIKKLNKEGDYSLGRAEDYEKNVVQPIRDNLDKAKSAFQKGPEGGFDKMLSDSMGKAGEAISGKISAGGATENSLGAGASMLGGGGGGSSGGGGGSSGGGGGSSGGGGGSSPTPTGSASSAGSDISKASSGVAEGQRMESSANMGSTINSPTTNNNSGSSKQKITPPPADTYNMEFLNLLART